MSNELRVRERWFSGRLQTDVTVVRWGVLGVPVLVISTASPMWTDDYKNYVHSLSPQTDYVTIAGTGHWLMLEKPAEFNNALTGLLQKFHLIAN